MSVSLWTVSIFSAASAVRNADFVVLQLLEYQEQMISRLRTTGLLVVARGRDGHPGSMVPHSVTTLKSCQSSIGDTSAYDIPPDIANVSEDFRQCGRA